MRNNILLVDDDESVCELLGGYLRLKEIPIEIAYARSGEEGLKTYQELKKRGADPALVLLDVRMPGMDGLETMNKLFEIDKDVNILLLTGYARTEKVARATESKAVGVIEKIGSYMLVICGIARAIAKSLVNCDNN